MQKLSGNDEVPSRLGYDFGRGRVGCAPCCVDAGLLIAHASPTQLCCGQRSGSQWTCACPYKQARQIAQGKYDPTA
jgi:hypothetical protein